MPLSVGRYPPRHTPHLRNTYNSYHVYHHAYHHAYHHVSYHVYRMSTWRECPPALLPTPFPVRLPLPLPFALPPRSEHLSGSQSQLSLHHSLAALQAHLLVLHPEVLEHSQPGGPALLPPLPPSPLLLSRPGPRPPLLLPLPSFALLLASRGPFSRARTVAPSPSVEIPAALKNFLISGRLRPPCAADLPSAASCSSSSVGIQGVFSFAPVRPGRWDGQSPEPQ